MEPFINSNITDSFYSYMSSCGDLYTREEKDVIYEGFLYYVRTGNLPNEAVAKQVLSKVGAISEKKNRYKQVLKIVRDFYGFDRNIIDVCAGADPVLSEDIDREQQITSKGTITALDPRIKQLKNGNIKVIRKQFDWNIDIKQYNLAIAIEPHDMTDRFIRRFNEEEIEFILYCCNCVPGFSEFDNMSLEDWQESTQYYAKTTLSDRGILFTELTEDKHLIIRTEYPYKSKRLLM